MRRLTAFLHRWQDLLFWLPLTVVVAYLAYLVIPAIDPRSGLDGWGDLFASLMAGVRGVLATIAAWACKSLYWHEPDAAEEARWRDLIAQDAVHGVAWRGFAAQSLDRLEFAAWLAFWCWVLF